MAVRVVFVPLMLKRQPHVGCLGSQLSVKTPTLTALFCAFEEAEKICFGISELFFLRLVKS